MKIGIKILPRDVLLDTQGRTVQEFLKKQSAPIKDCRIGKYIILEFENVNSDQAKQLAQNMAEKTLINPLIESFSIEVL